jgi:hypothetical protein
MSGRLVPRDAPAGGVAGRLAGRLLDLAADVRRLDLPQHRTADRATVASRIEELARDAAVTLAEGEIAP